MTPVDEREREVLYLSVEELIDLLVQVTDKSKPVFIVPVGENGQTLEIEDILECGNALTIFSDVYSGGSEE